MRKRGDRGGWRDNLQGKGKKQTERETEMETTSTYKHNKGGINDSTDV